MDRAPENRQSMPAQDSSPRPDTDTPLWRFALALWQQDQARHLCLQLQQQGWSVTRLLCAGWLASRGIGYSGDDPLPLRQWRTDVTEAIRSLKKSLSKSDSLVAPLREALARAELESERVELYQAWLAFRYDASATSVNDLTGVAERNLRQAAPDTSGSINGKTEPMIRHLAQLINRVSEDGEQPA